MSFEMKYDKHGNPVRNPDLEKQLKEAEPTSESTPSEPSLEASENQESIEQEIIQAEPSQTETSQPEPTQERKQQAQQSDRDENIKELRRQAAEAKRFAKERDEYARRLKELEATNKPRQQEDDEDIRIADDDIAEGKHLRSVSKQVKSLREENKKLQQQMYLTSTELRLKSEFPDFYNVVNKDNLDALKDQEPMLAESISNDPDAYRQMVAAYKLIKKVGIHKDEALIRDKELVQRNVAKPKPVASISAQTGDSPLSRANAFAEGLTPELKAQLYKEMKQYSR